MDLLLVFKQGIFNILHNKKTMPLGQILHDIGYAKADIKREYSNRNLKLERKTEELY